MSDAPPPPPPPPPPEQHITIEVGGDWYAEVTALAERAGMPADVVEALLYAFKRSPSLVFHDQVVNTEWPPELLIGLINVIERKTLKEAEQHNHAVIEQQRIALAAMANKVTQREETIRGLVAEIESLRKELGR